MAEYIEREAAIADLELYETQVFKSEYALAIAGCRSHIRAIPAADVTPVVRCKDCKHSYEDLCGRVCSYGVSVDCVVPDDFFCADGAKMEDME